MIDVDGSLGSYTIGQCCIQASKASSSPPAPKYDEARPFMKFGKDSETQVLDAEICTPLMQNQRDNECKEQDLIGLRGTDTE